MSAVAASRRAAATSSNRSAKVTADPWAPFRVHIFRAVWIAALVSNVGSWMHLIAASWLMTSLTASAALVALLQTAAAAPSVAVALPAGAMADVFDRRRLIIVTQGYQALIAAALGVMTLADATTPAVLLGATLALGAGATLGLPAYSAITPELVPGDQLPAAISLNTITSTASQAAGPALGGLLVAAAGAGAVFLLNAASFLVVVAVIARWRRPKPSATLPPEHIGSAIRTGLRYAAHAPELRTVLIRCAAYVTAFSAVPALLALTTRTRLGGSAASYGVLLGLVGLGGITAAVLLPRFRTRFRTDRLVGVATVAHAGVMVALASLHSIAAIAPVMVISGFALMTVMSSLNIAAQVVLPAWVRGRGLAIFQLIFQLGFAGGAALWGTLASSDGIATALTAAAIALFVSMLLAVRYRLDSADGIDVRPAYQPEPHLPVAVEPDDGPVLVEVEYLIDADTVDAFDAASADVRRVRLRDGAMHWALFQDTDRPERLVESFLVRSWTEHQRQGERQTVGDKKALDRILAFHTGVEAPATRRLLGHHFRHLKSHHDSSMALADEHG